MSVTAQTQRWVDITEVLISLTYVPAALYLIQMTLETILLDTDWTYFKSILRIWPKSLWNIFKSWTVWIYSLGMILPQIWILKDFRQIAIADKIPGGALHNKVQRRSTFILLLTSVSGLIYSSWAIAMEYFYGYEWSRIPRTLAQAGTGFISIATGISYLITVNTYNHQSI